MIPSADQATPAPPNRLSAATEFDNLTRSTDLERRSITVAGILVVVSLLLTGWQTARNTGCSGPRKSKLASTEMNTLLTSVELYQLTRGRAPETLDDLVTSDLLRALTPDPWGSPYQLHANPERTRWAVCSAGPDRLAGTLDDLIEFGPGRDQT